MKRNFLLALTCGCALASWSAEPLGISPIFDDGSDIKLKPSVAKVLPNGAHIEIAPSVTPVGDASRLRKISTKGYILDSLVAVKPDDTKQIKQHCVFDKNGKILELNNYVYDAATKDWKINMRYFWTWLDSGYMKSDEQEDAKGNAVRNEYKYNAQNLGIEKLTTKRTGFDGEYVNYNKGEYDYDDRGNMTKENTFKWANNEWVPIARITAAYDENNYRSAFEDWRYKDGVWTGKEKKEYKTNKKGLQTYILNYSWERKNTGVFEPFARMTNKFSAKNDTALVQQLFEYYNIDTNDWLGNFKDRGGAERNNMIAVHERDDRDRDIFAYGETLYGTEWVRGSESTYKYTDNADGSYECVKTNKRRPRDAKDFEVFEIVTTKVDSKGRTTFYHDDYLPDKKRSSQWIDTYDDKGNKLGREGYKFNADGVRLCDLKSVNTYDNYGNIIDTYNWKGKKNDKGIADTWVYSNRFTYNYEMNGTQRTDKKRYKYEEASESWANDWGEGGDFDFTVPVSDIMIPSGYDALYMQTAKYNYKGKGEDWEATKYTYYYSKNKDNGVDNATITDNRVTFGNNILRVNGGMKIDNSVYSTDGKLVFKGNNGSAEKSGA